MADYSTMSDADLMAMVKPPAQDYSKLSDADLLKMVKPQETPSLGAADTATDVAKSGGIGLAKGAIGMAGAPGDLSNLLARGSQYASNYIADKTGLDRGPQIDDGAQRLSSLTPGEPRNNNILPTAGGIQKAIEGYTGDFYKPKTTAGEYAQTAGEFAPGLMGGEGSLLARGLSRVAIPAATSETAGQLTKGTDAEPWARVAGGLLSPAVTAAGRRAITPLPATAERTALANALTGEGVDLTAGQRTGSRPLQWAESTFGDMPGSGGRAAAIQTNQGEQFTGAALRRVGENANRATPEVIDNAFHRIGGQFDDIASRNHIATSHLGNVVTGPLGNDLAAVEHEYNSLVGPTQRAPVVANTINDIGNFVEQNGGHITGEQYNSLTSRLARQARGATADPQLREALTGTREALDNAFERSLQASGNTQDLASLREARNQYRNMMVIEKAATGAGAQTAEGIISPSQLRNATVGQNRRSYARGQGDFADLARSGEAIMKPLPNSGTSPREYMRHAMSTIGSVIGGTAGSAGGPAGTAAGAVAGLAAPGLLGRALMSGPAQRYLGNQAVLPDHGSRMNQALAAALLAHQGNHDRITVQPHDANR
jgi:hypothetical protein